MNNSQESSFVVGLDIGSANTTAIVGEVMADGAISVVQLASEPSRGISKGGVTDLDSASRTVRSVLLKAGQAANCEVVSVNLSVSGHHISCQNEKGMFSVGGNEVVQADVDDVIHTAQSVKIPNEREILHVMSQEFSMDGIEGTKTAPLGISGMRLEANVHIVTSSGDWLKNIRKCVERSDFQVDSVIFSGLASADAVLTEDERALGVCLVDIGAGTTDIVIYTGGALRHCAVIPVGGNQVSNDIAQIFRTPLQNAEQIKLQFASARSDRVSKEEYIEVPSVGGRPARSLQRQTLAEVVEPRYQEMFELIAEKLRESGLQDQIAAGIVLTGGAAQMDGTVDVAEQCFGVPVRIATPLSIKGLTEYNQEPGHATAFGLLRLGSQKLLEQQREQRDSNGLNQLMSRMHNWLKGQF